MGRVIWVLVSCVVVIVTLIFYVDVTYAHRSGCHRWHSCPSDSGSYVCGDLGISTYCGTSSSSSTSLSGLSSSGGSTYTYVPPTAVPTAVPATPIVDWRTYDTDSTFSGYWGKHGGLAIFGLAKTKKYINTGSRYAQVFERNRLEWHPENRAPYDIQLGLLGEERLLQIGRVWHNEPKYEQQPNCLYFVETRHNICGKFLQYWRSNGIEFDGRPGYSIPENLALFGYPITEATMETGSDGVSRLTQWFQRARFEDHGKNGVLLGLLGNEVFGQ